MSRALDTTLSQYNFEQELKEVIPDADEWRKMRNDRLGGKTPNELLSGTDEDREQVRNLIEAVKHGMVS